MKSLGIVGSYRKGGNTDSAVTAILEGSNDSGYKSEKVYLTDQEVGLVAPGEQLGHVVVDDALAGCLASILHAGATVPAKLDIQVGQVP